ncbi:MAG: CcoQ/FixQ family Cbb3-type cytochrome c oxidase assembly chaperone [Flavobacteriales bacterium]|nr:CcoQ/FixQ family Cbb3-type cytochrome c oxidase assembly chaperone [Flavobacteriales bacterium]HCA83306.1 CcoQ/FixQ family Cbb3-type cytochrome c oxidase assembly chaperone [Flavobacteriales bacterium]HRE74104.1 CcoQ/FixQ family Cbb3-type cytochrome c oxidase assembly chaperone [Flavobacteriales bacterium]HRE95135.1 CcoQ/FixQ family Cbb3-type cytochrome c oxidase assembly chaperone [Flavobacteriales bacterium]HRJ35909.1 CcoQ/FixQ family Cbb3-type cytochrome c oxidase assembly chaperone [Flav
MKFINYLTSIDGVGIFPVVSLIIFFTFFIALLVYIMKVDKKLISHMEQLPFEDNDQQ